MVLPAGAQNFNVLEFQSFLKQACNSVNDRPLAIKSSGTKSDGALVPVTPNLLLLGRTSTSPPSQFIETDDNSKLTVRIKLVQEIESQFWQIWFAQIWDTLFPKNRWKEVKENLQEGDICLKGSIATLGKARYILCRVKKTFPDENGLVRTVKLEFRPKDSRDPTLPYVSKNLVEEKIAVQKLVLVCRKKNLPTDPSDASEN